MSSGIDEKIAGFFSIHSLVATISIGAKDLLSASTNKLVPSNSKRPASSRPVRDARVLNLLTKGFLLLEINFESIPIIIKTSKNLMITYFKVLPNDHSFIIYINTSNNR